MDLHFPHRRHLAALLVDGQTLKSADPDPCIPAKPEDVRWTLAFDGTLDETDEGFRRALELDLQDAVAPVELLFDNGEAWRCPAKLVVLQGRARWRIMVLPLVTPTVTREDDP